MRSATLRVPFKNSNNRFASSMFTAPQPVSSTFTTVQIPIEQSSQTVAKAIKDQQKEQQNKSNNSKWYQKKWKSPAMLGTGAATGIIIKKIHPDAAESENESLKTEFAELEQENKGQLDNAKQIQKINLILQARYLNSKDTQTAAPKLHDLFLKIKKDLGITENIELRLEIIDDTTTTTADATYLPQYNCILINSNYNNWDSFQIIRVLVHELEHVKQIYHYPDSYKLSNLEEYQKSKIKGEKSDTGAHLKAETGADASAAGYFDCPECLSEIAKQFETKQNPLLNYNPQELQSGHFTTELGYFAPEDYDPYIQRACTEGDLCQGHKILGKPKTIKYSKQHDAMKYDSYYAQQYDQDYLNQKFNTLREQKQSELPVELFLPKSV